MPPTARNDYEEKLLANINKTGWQATAVLGDDDGPPFAYTIGLFHSFQFPELLIIGLDGNAAHQLFSIFAKGAQVTLPFDMTKPAVHVLGDYRCFLVDVPKEHYDNLVLSSLWFYEGNDFPLKQVVWADENQHFPWQPGVSDSFKAQQPVLGTPPGGQP